MRVADFLLVSVLFSVAFAGIAFGNMILTRFGVALSVPVYLGAAAFFTAGLLAFHESNNK